MVIHFHSLFILQTKANSRWIHKKYSSYFLLPWREFSSKNAQNDLFNGIKINHIDWQEGKACDEFEAWQIPHRLQIPIFTIFLVMHR